MNLESWQSFSKNQQLLAIGAELTRAGIWQKKDRAKFLSALERALGLLNLSLEDSQWRGQTYILWWLRQELARFHAGLASYDIEKLFLAF